MKQWQIVFWICCGLIALSFITFLLMASGEEQSWANSLDAPVVDYNTTQYIDDTNRSINPDSLGQGLIIKDKKQLN